MHCPVCAEEGKTSRVEGGDVWEVAVRYSLSFADDAGRWHHHDGTVRHATCTCSAGHRWRVAMHQTCWCGWSGKDTAVARRGDNRGVPLALPAGAMGGEHDLTWTPL